MPVEQKPADDYKGMTLEINAFIDYIRQTFPASSSLKTPLVIAVNKMNAATHNRLTALTKFERKYGGGFIAEYFFPDNARKAAQERARLANAARTDIEKRMSQARETKDPLRNKKIALNSPGSPEAKAQRINELSRHNPSLSL